jgi:predicted RNA polymerase sigma factor
MHLEASGALPACHLLLATRADLHERHAEAATACRRALELATVDAERRYLARRRRRPQVPADGHPGVALCF